MEEFLAIEAKFKRTPIRVPDHPAATGVLRLHGRKSRLELSSPTPIYFEATDENGWFNLQIRASDGRDLLIHNAVTLSSSHHHWGEISDDAYVLQIFPNVVVDDLRGLTGNHRVQSISFQLKGLHNFFYYRHSEPLSAYEITPEQLEVLRSMRFPHSRDDGPFDPREIYVIHNFPILINFRVADRTYEVWQGGIFNGLNLDRVDARTFPIAKIRFDEPVDLETALDRVWEWRRFYAQMAMTPLALKSVSVRPTLEDRAPNANVYLPNLKRRQRQIEGAYALSPRHLAFNFWSEREQLASAMQTWLERSGERDQFRARLNRVIERMDRRLDPSDLVDLASAVDSLDELAPASPLAKDVLNAMTDAAHAAAAGAKVSIERDRIRGLLGSIQRPSLAARFVNLGARLEVPLDAADAELLARSATQIRNASAHGHAIDDQIQPRISPTIQALTALCARFDLETCGFPTRSSANARTMTKLRFDNALEHLRALGIERPRS